MIKRVFARPRTWAKENEGRILQYKIPVISIGEPGNLPVFGNTDHSLALIFDECDALRAWMDKGKKRPFDCAQAKKVLEFIDKMNLRTDKNAEFMVVHCIAGINRSGAIATFTQRYLNLDVKTFNHDNPFILPNEWVMNMMATAALMKGVKK